MNARAELLKRLIRKDESVSICTRSGGGAFTPRILRRSEAARFPIPSDRDTYFSVNPLRGDASGRGNAEDVTRLAALWADLDVKPGSFSTLEAAKATVVDLGGVLGTPASFVIFSGHGLQPIWLLDSDDPETSLDDPRTRAGAQSILRAWRSVVVRAARRHGADDIDNVFDLPRLLRLPGSRNLKDPGCPVVVTLDSDPNTRPIVLADVRSVLDEHEVSDSFAHRDPVAAAADPTSWRWAESTCAYVRGMVARWSTDTPSAGRHQWLLKNVVRLAAAHRAGCLSQDDHRGALARLGHRYEELLRMSPVRSQHPREQEDAHVWAIRKVTNMSEEQVRDELGSHDHGPPSRSRLGEAAAAEVLFDTFAANYDLYRMQDGEPFAVPKPGRGPRGHIARMLKRGKNDFGAELSALYRARTGKIVSSQARNDALLTIEGEALYAATREVHLRVAEHDGEVLIDTGDPAGHVVALRDGGWRLVTEVPVLFRRTALTGPMPLPVRGGDLEELWRVVNVALDDRPVVLAFLVAALLCPQIPHPILALFGEQGSGKSSAARVLTALIDPSPVPLRQPPKDKDRWVTAAQGSYAVALDNLSTVPGWLSDTLCRASTGEGDVHRRLWSDDDLVVFTFRRVIILTGIDVGAIRGDLAERLMKVELHPISEAERRTETELDARWSEGHPKMLGALLDLAAEVQKLLPTIVLPRMPRMADFARVLAGVDLVLGTDGMHRYTDQARSLARENLDSEPFLVALQTQVREPWKGTSADLLEKLSPPEPQKDWPRDARTVTGHLRQNAPVLRAAGWTVENLGNRNKAGVHLWSIAPPSPSPSDGSVEPTEREAEAGGARPAIHDAAAEHTNQASKSQGRGALEQDVRTPSPVDARTRGARVIRSGQSIDDARTTTSIRVIRTAQNIDDAPSWKRSKS